MLKKMALIGLVFGLLIQNTSVMAQYISVQQIYSYARQGNLKSLQALKHQIDITDSYGNTALCYSVMNNDYKTFNLLRQANASVQSKCINNINSEQIKSFNDGYARWYQSVAKQVSNQAIKGVSAKVATTGLSVGAKVGIGVGIVALVGGGIAAAAGGGGGGGSSSSETDNAVLNCKNGNWNGSKCVCQKGYTGTLCEAPKEVPSGYQATACGAGYDTADTFLSGETTYYKCTPKDCSVYETSCGAGYNATQSCISGTTQYYTCTPKDIPSGYTSTSCTSGYDLVDTVYSGETTYYKCTPKDCSAYETSCGVGYNATQSCISGTTQYYTCTPKEIPSGYTSTSCTSGYDLVDTVYSGETAYYKCTPKEVPTGYQATACGAGYDTADTFLSGETTYYQCTPKDCSAYKTSCGAGYNATQSCISGTTQYYTCTPKDIPSGYTSTSCTSGYDLVDTVYSGETAYYKCTPKEVPTGYQATACGAGYDTADTFLSGETTYYKCTPKDCSAYETSCGVGYNATQSCISGTTQYYTCTPKEIPSGYTSTSCTSGYDLVDTVYSGETAYYKCTPKEVPSGYQATACGAGYDTADTFLSGETTYYKCTAKICESEYKLTCSTNEYETSNTCISGEDTLKECKMHTNISNCDVYSTTSDICSICKVGYTGPDCSQIADGYIEQNGQIYQKLICVYGTQIANICECLPHASGTLCETLDVGYIEDSSGNISCDIVNGYGKNGNGECVLKGEDLIGDSNSTNVSLENSEYRDIYGKKDTYNASTWGNASSGFDKYSQSTDLTSIISINNNSDANIYGFSGTINAKADNYGASLPLTSLAVININNSGNGSVYGLYGATHNAYASSYQSSDKAESMGKIRILNMGLGTSYGIYGNTSSTVYNAKASASGFGSYTNFYVKAYASGYIHMINLGKGTMYGMFAEKIDNRNETIITSNTTHYTSVSKSYINIANVADGLAVGMYGTSNAENSGDITIYNLSDGTSMGITTDANGIVTNKGTIIINKENYADDKGTPDKIDDDIVYSATTQIGGISYGIHGSSDSTITNSGTITITGAETGYGIYHAGNGGSINNTETGIIDVTATNAYGIYVKDGTNTTVTNSGTIKLNGVECTGDCSGGTTNGNYIVLNGATLVNAGTMTAKTMNLDDMGGDVVATKGSTFNVQDKLSGTLNVSADAVQNGFDTTYQLSDVIQAGNTDELKLASQSAMFDAQLSANKNDIMMTMKSFDKMTDNKSLASFLDKNYAQGNNESFFNTLKSFKTGSAFSSSLNSLTGKETLSQFNYEDLSAMREVSLAMNEIMFNNQEQPIFETMGTINSFSFKNDSNSTSQYAIGRKRINSKFNIGYGMSHTNISSDDDNDTTRRNQIFQTFMPMGYAYKGWQMISTPQMGYARGYYNRKGFNDTTYEGYIEKRIVALTNEARYPMQFGDVEIAPTVELNAIAYNQKGKEDDKAYALTIPSENNLSVEAGLGLHAKSQIGNLKLNGGLMVYQEFADPYNIKMGMQGMEGTFDLYDNRSKYRGVGTFGFDYSVGGLNMYGNLQHFIEDDNHTKFKTGLKFEF